MANTYKPNYKFWGKWRKKEIEQELAYLAKIANIKKNVKEKT